MLVRLRLLLSMLTWTFYCYFWPPPSTAWLSQQHSVLHAKELVGWLSVLPLEKDQFDLSAQQFRMGLGLVLPQVFAERNLPGKCDGCDATLTVDHALDCRFGGLVTSRHNEVRDAVGNLASLVWILLDVSPWRRSLVMINKTHYLLIWLSVEFGNPSARAFSISGWCRTQMNIIGNFIRTTKKQNR